MTKTHRRDLQILPLDQVRPSATNPRRVWDEASLQELAESIREHGVLQPAIVRASADKEGYELVAGERRYRASKLAGIDTIPAIVRALTDEQVLEVQLIENAQRVDVDAIGEAEAIAALVQKHGNDVAELAARLGRSKSWVYSRLRLNSVVPEVKRLVESGTLKVSDAHKLAQCHEEIQRSIAEEAESGKLYDVERAIDRRTHLIDEAPWGTMPCSTCDRSTAAQTSLFGAENARCLDHTCWAKRLDLWWDEQKESRETIDGEDAYRVLTSYGWIVPGAPYQDASNRPECLDEQSWEEAYPDVEQVLVRHEDGHIYRVIHNAQLRQAAQKVGHKKVVRYLTKGKTKELTPTEKIAEEQQLEEKRKAKVERHKRRVTELVERIEQEGLTDALLEEYLRTQLADSWSLRDICERRDIKFGSFDKAAERILWEVTERRERLALLVEAQCPQRGDHGALQRFRKAVGL